MGNPIERPLRGVVPPMVTPLSDPGHLDAAGTARLVEHILAGGVHGFFLLGTTGEAPDLPYAVRHELVRRVCEQVSGRVPVLVGVTDTMFDESLRLAETAADAGAAAVRPLDLAILIAYLVGVTVFGCSFYLRKSAKGTKGFVAGGGHVPSWAIGLSFDSKTRHLVDCVAEAF